MTKSDWIPWKHTMEKPFPETLDTLVRPRFNDGTEFKGFDRVEYWFEDGRDSNWYQGRNNRANGRAIVAYQVVRA